MGTYIALLRFEMDPAAGAATKLQDAADLLERYVKQQEASGLEVRASYLTLGVHDALIVMEAPGDKEVARLTASSSTLRPRIRTEVLRGFTREQCNAFLPGGGSR